MPYSAHLRCDKCGDYFSLDVDQVATIESYVADGRPSPQINQATLIWDYLIYSCSNCKTQYRLTYKDVEARVRDYFSRQAEKYKLYFEELTKFQDTEEARRSGLFFIHKDSEVKRRIEKIYKAKN